MIRRTAVLNDIKRSAGRKVNSGDIFQARSDDGKPEEGISSDSDVKIATVDIEIRKLKACAN